MLHFTETGTDACPEYLEASARFDAERDTEEFETRVAELVRRACAKEVESAKADGREAEFSGTLQQAYAALQQEDHYILVMIDQSEVMTERNRGQSAPRKKFLGLF